MHLLNVWEIPQIASWNIAHVSEAYPEPNQSSKIEIFAKTVNYWKPLTIFVKGSF